MNDDIDKRLCQMEFCLKLLVGLVSAWAGSAVVLMIDSIPQQMIIIQEMLPGGRNEMPVLVRWIAAVHPILLPLAIAVTCAGVMFAAFIPRRTGVIGTSAVLIVLMAGHSLLTLALRSPVLKIIQGISGQ